MRLLLCRDCRSIEELPDFEGQPENDVLLDNLVQRHRFPNGEEHVGGLAHVEDADWEDEHRRKAILNEINNTSKQTGFQGDYYDSKNTYQEDAMKCFRKHKRPEGFCIDWKSEKKRIGDPMKNPMAPKVFLCDFCPVASTVMEAQRYEYGAYDKKPKTNPKDIL